MPVKIRLARRGRNNLAVYSIVAADARAPRDGKFIKKLGMYNPNTSPSTLEIDSNLVLEWIKKGAQLTETVRSLCSASGIMLLKHLCEGVEKGAITPIVARKRFMDWHKLYKTKKNKKVSSIVSPELAESSFKAIVPTKKIKKKSIPATKEKEGVKKNKELPKKDKKNELS